MTLDHAAADAADREGEFKRKESLRDLYVRAFRQGAQWQKGQDAVTAINAMSNEQLETLTKELRAVTADKDRGGKVYAREKGGFKH
jgi:mannitol/fructose-specific phosphotransferase system IIA component